jgi:GMP synthase-like glutamine amidotransferase
MPAVASRKSMLIVIEHNSFEDIPWINTLVDFTAKVLKQGRVRTIGVCFGHQIVARAMGVKVGRNEDGWEAAVNDIDLTERGKQLFGKEKLVMLHHSPKPVREPQVNTIIRAFIKCTETSHSTTQKAWNS